MKKTTISLWPEKYATRCRVALVLFALFLFQAPAFADPVYPFIPYVKGWCCASPETGVFDLSGSWQGIIPNGPTPGPFPGPEFFYSDLGSVGQSLMTFELVDQQVYDALETGGQQVIQTYTGQLIQTWYESSNVDIEECLATPQASKNMCQVVRQVVNYDLDFSLRWCKGVDGFVLMGLVSTDINMTYTDTTRTIAKRMVINPQAGEYCPTIVVSGSPIAYDYESNLVLGYPVGGQVAFSFGEPNPYDVLEYTVGTRDDCWCEGGGTNLPIFSMIKKLGAADIAELKGDVRFTISSDLPLDLVNAPFRPEGQFNLLRQSALVRDRLPGELDVEWNAYLESVKDAFSFVDATPSFDGTEFRFSGLPLFDVVTIDGRDVVRPARYALRLRGLNVEEYVTGSDPLVSQFTQFSGADEFNIQTGELNALTVTPLDGIPIKKDLINVLSLMSPTNYVGPENLALAHVNTLEAGSPTPSQLEGLKRAILAERIARDGGRFGEQQIKAMLTGLNTVMSSLITELFAKVGTGKELKEKKKIKSALDDELDAAALANDGWSALPEDAEVIKSSMKDLIDENFDLEISLLAEKIKSLLGLALSVLKDGLISAGLEPETAELVSTVVSTVVNTVLDTVITQGLGQFESAAQAAVKLAIDSAQDEMFDTLPGAYTDRTLEAVTYSQQQFEAWATDNDSAFRTDRRNVEQELVLMGIEAYDNIGAANALNIVSEGFANTSSLLDTFNKFPPVKKAQIIAKVGQYLTGATSFVVPLKGAYWDTPFRVREGVAKSYGEESANVFPLAGSITRVESIETTAALPNGLGNNLVDPLRATLNQIRTRVGTSFGNLSQEWSTNSIADVLDILNGADADDFPALFGRFERELADVLAMGAAYQGDSIAASQMQNAFTRASIGFEQRIAEVRAGQFDLLNQIFLREFSGPNDPRYEARRAAMLQDLVRLSNATRGLRLAANEYRLLTNSQPFGSAVVLRDIQLFSNATAQGMVTQNNEIFTLSASVRNLGQSVVTGVEVELSLPLAANAIILSTAIQAAGSGTLAANDGSPGSGADEAIVSWQVQYTGTLDDQVNVPLALEARSTTVDDPGFYGTGYTVLLVDPETFDPDGDGMPTAWENDNELNPAVDDGDGDADSDGVSNSDEFDRELDPQVKDSDQDGLEDGEELAGVNGWITDPADDDTDDDGVLDGADGSPLDPTSSASEPGLEPVVAVSTNQVTLNADTPQADLAISNAGTGTLIWVVSSGDSTLVQAGSGSNQVQTGSLLTLQLAPGLDVAANDGQQVQVTVQDVFGAVADQQVITVSIGDPPPQEETLFLDGFESP